MVPGPKATDNRPLGQAGALACMLLNMQLIFCVLFLRKEETDMKRKRWALAVMQLNLNWELLRSLVESIRCINKTDFGQERQAHKRKLFFLTGDLNSFGARDILKF